MSVLIPLFLINDLAVEHFVSSFENDFVVIMLLSLSWLWVFCFENDFNEGSVIRQGRDLASD